ncbi:hypothetical protein ACFRKE_18890 [Kitasatospora indigofera]|uniref:hypothetical protein n=1 Tax=Kitasatospora indigofera TaxID=67307 RepID=UPI0036B8D72D
MPVLVPVLVLVLVPCERVAVRVGHGTGTVGGGRRAARGCACTDRPTAALIFEIPCTAA